MRKSGLSLGTADDGTLLSHDEFAEAQFEEPWRYERFEGRLVVMTPSGHDHQITGGPIRDQLGAFRITHLDLVDYVIDEAWIRIDEETERIADIAVYLTGGSGRIPQRTPELVFEIVSGDAESRRRDYEEKRRDYERIGVREYVIVDRFKHSLTVLRLVNASYEATRLGPEDAYTSALLPGLDIPLVEII